MMLILFWLFGKRDVVICCQVKTTSPDGYRVRPSTGLIKPQNVAEISIYLQSGKLKFFNNSITKWLVICYAVCVCACMHMCVCVCVCVCVCEREQGDYVIK